MPRDGSGVPEQDAVVILAGWRSAAVQGVGGIE
jgi:hypothetical protein